MEIRLLGPLELHGPLGPIAVRGTRQRTLLAVLALFAGRTVSSAQLIGHLWGEEPPGNPANALHARIFQLRRTIGVDLVVATPTGYRLEVPRAVVDALRFEDHVASARVAREAGQPDLARDRLRAGLALWRGEALGDVPAADEDPALRGEVVRLSSLRLGAMEQLYDIELARGRHVEVEPELAALTHQHPEHERFWAQLMVARYRAGRQADALRAYQEARRYLVDELGLEAGPELRDLEGRIARQEEPLRSAAPRGPASATETAADDMVPPPLTRRHLARARLDDVLDDAIDATVVLVSAPAGAGKSVALAGWVERRRPAARWWSLDDQANDPAVFWPHLAAGLGASSPEAIRTGPGCLAALRHDTGADRDRRQIVVLDDFHLVTNPVIHADLDRFLAAAGGVTVVLATRHDPPLRLAQLRAAGRLRELRFDQLRFDEDELAELLNVVLALGLSGDDLDRLATRTEGWAVGIQLAALSLEHQENQSALVAEFAGDDRHVADYLQDEVVANLPEDLRRFVLGTSLLDRFTAPLCAAVTGVADAQRLLDDLERRNLFLVALDRRRQWYRYHHLFAEWLRLHAGEDAIERHRRAGEWYAEHGHAADAIHHFLQAGEAERAADVIDDERWALVGQGRQQTLRQWVRRLPDPVLRRRRGLALAAAWIAYDAGHWEDVSRLVEVLQRAQPDDEASRQGRLAAAEVALLRAGSAAARGELGTAASVALAALATLPEEEPRARTGLLSVIGKVQLLQDDLDGARRSFTGALLLAERWGVTIIEVIAHAHLGEIARRLGRAREADAEARTAVELAARHGLDEHPEVGVAHLVLGLLELDRGARNAGEDAIRRGSRLIGRVPYVPRERLCALAMERLAESQGTRDPGRGIEPLTDRERTVLRLLPSSLTVADIARELYLSVNTVKTHLRALYRKLGVTTRHAAVEEARRRHLL